MQSVTAISLGAGIQSSAMVYLANEGIIHADFAIFADTGNERDETYKYLEYLEKNSKIPIIRARNTRSGTITEDLEKAVNDDSKYWEGFRSKQEVYYRVHLLSRISKWTWICKVFIRQLV